MKISLKARLTNKTFWLALCSAIILLAQQLGFDIFPENAMEIVNTVLLIATILGVVVDPTTEGVGDSQRVFDRVNHNIEK